ncbi:hypothetical protein [Iningainema tapete]|uniref:Uncharacterized protein n=1 Tax=Iningainema tapete BLCC-T55 TaxID=2748662 RepID=A0A8J6XE62_9CYAN|nr:hypothetical protein [Iningainema tapete]MBD2770862.1 hypothetical protein [Iningainema tapete BLCC-T55]
MTEINKQDVEFVESTSSEFVESISSDHAEEPQTQDTQSVSNQQTQETQLGEISTPQVTTTGKIIEFTRKKVVPWLWAAVIALVIIPLIGQLFIANAFKTPLPSNPNPPSKIVESKPLDWAQAEKFVATALQNAHKSAENYASQKLDAWVDNLIGRVDSSFLDWYFGYFNQKQIEYKGFFAGVTANMARWLNPNSQDPQERVAEVITENFQIEFSNRVLRPQIAQLQLERITNQTVKYYLEQLSLNINQIPEVQQIPKADWERYLREIAISAEDVEGNSLSLPLKALLGGGAYTAVKPLIAPMLPTVSSKIVAKLAGKAGFKIAEKTGAVVASKIGSALLDTTVGVGILLWDIWDVNHTANIEKPILKASLVDYLKGVADSLLNNHDNGIMAVIDKVEYKIMQGVDVAKSISSSN